MITEMSFCYDCGAELAHTEKACPLCGNRLYRVLGTPYGAYPSNYEEVPRTGRFSLNSGLTALIYAALYFFRIDFL
jgi:predicted amidophosphoribosyltransferase